MFPFLEEKSINKKKIVPHVQAKYLFLISNTCKDVLKMMKVNIKKSKPNNLLKKCKVVHSIFFYIALIILIFKTNSPGGILQEDLARRSRYFP